MFSNPWNLFDFKSLGVFVNGQDARDSAREEKLLVGEDHDPRHLDDRGRDVQEQFLHAHKQPHVAAAFSFEQACVVLGHAALALEVEDQKTIADF